jgi:uncharacterized protein YpmS
MRTTGLNTLFVVLLVVTLILFTAYYVFDSVETQETDYGGLKEITGKAQSFEVTHGESNFYHLTKKNTERYDDKLYGYKVHLKERRDETFLR